jgi:hypothetical protein
MREGNALTVPVIGNFFRSSAPEPLAQELKGINDLALRIENLTTSLADSPALRDLRKAEEEVYLARRALIGLLARLEDSGRVDQPGLCRIEAVANALGGYSEENRNCPAVPDDGDTLLKKMSEMAKDDENAKRSLMLGEYSMLLGILYSSERGIQEVWEQKNEEFRHNQLAFVRAQLRINYMYYRPTRKMGRNRLSVKGGNEAVADGYFWRSYFSSWPSDSGLNSIVGPLNPSNLPVKLDQLRRIEEGTAEGTEEHRAGEPTGTWKKAQKYWTELGRMLRPEKMEGSEARNLWKIARIHGGMSDIQEQREDVAELLGGLDIEDSCKPLDASGDQHCIAMAALLGDVVLGQNVSKNMADGLYNRSTRGLYSPSQEPKELEEDKLEEDELGNASH